MTEKKLKWEREILQYCPCCGKEKIGIDSLKVKNIPPREVDGHCASCDIWITVKDVTDEEKLEMFERSSKKDKFKDKQTREWMY